MDVQYCFASPEGDLLLSADALKKPFMENLETVREDFSLGAYFQALQDFLLREHPLELLEVIQQSIPGCLSYNDIELMILRSEKHGAFYHIASLEIRVDGRSVKLALSSALTDLGKRYLEQDCRLLGNLLAGPGPHAVPESYFFNTIVIVTESGEVEMSVALLEWFEDYHEWHLSEEGQDGQMRFCVWDMRRGNYFLSNDMGARLIREISQVLTRYYNPNSAQQIYPWHHAAGDLIVKISDESVDVKLITVRGYQPFCSTDEINPAAWLANMIRFFLHVSIRIRLDKLDGVGRTVWLDDRYVKPFIEGLLAAYGEKFQNGDVPLAVNDFINVLKMFDHAELLAMCRPLLTLYEGEIEADYLLVSQKILAHVQSLCFELQKM
jgi:hypothetical protein